MSTPPPVPPASASTGHPTHQPAPWPARAARWPGLAACVVVALACLALTTAARPWVPALSPLLLAILAGVAWQSTGRVPAALSPGVAFAAKPVLRAGIVLLGLQLVLADVLALGPGVLGLVVAVVALTFGAAVMLGRLLGLPTDLTVLVASGFSICGAAAVAGADSVVRARREMAATAIGLVVLFGTLMIPLLPFLTAALGMDERAAGLWIGASTHEVAQVVAAGGLVGAGALQVAVTVKLARVLMLAPVLAGLGWRERRRSATAAAASLTADSAAAGLDHDGGGSIDGGGGKDGGGNADDQAHRGAAPASRPPLVPWFVLGFIALMLVRSTGLVPEAVLDVAALAQQLLLATAMAALGLGLDLRATARLGPRPLVLGAGTTAVALGIGGSGAALLG